MNLKRKRQLWFFGATSLFAATLVGIVYERHSGREFAPSPLEHQQPQAQAKLRPSGLKITPASMPAHQKQESELLAKTQTDTNVEIRNIKVIKLQFAAALREADFVALNRFITEEYGIDDDLDGLIVEGARRLALSGRPEYIKASFRALSKAYETTMTSKNPRKEGKIVHILEALGDHSSSESTRLLTEVLENSSLSRVPKGAAVQSLVAQNAKSAASALRTYSKTLKAQIDELQSDNRDQNQNEELEFAADNYYELLNAIAILEN